MILAALAAAALHPTQQAVLDCMTTAVVALGAGNSEPAGDVIKAAEWRCEPEWSRLRKAWEGNEFVRAMLGEPRVDDEAHDRAMIGAAAFDALMKARQ